MLSSMLQRQRSVVGLCGRCSVGCRAALIRRSTLRAFSLKSSRENDVPQNDVPRADAIAAARSLRELTAADTLYNRLLRLVGNASGAKLPLEASQHASTLIGLLSSRDAVRRRVATRALSNLVVAADARGDSPSEVFLPDQLDTLRPAMLRLLGDDRDAQQAATRLISAFEPLDIAEQVAAIAASGEEAVAAVREARRRGGGYGADESGRESSDVQTNIQRASQAFSRLGGLALCGA